MVVDGQTSSSSSSSADPASSQDGPTIIYEANMSAGDFIFVPQLWAHQVQNVDATIAISDNFLDDHSFGNYVRLTAALLKFIRNAPKGTVDASALHATGRRLARAGFARDGMPGFPWYSLRSLQPDHGESTWEEYAAHNAWHPPAEVMSSEAHDEAFKRWAAGGGLGRFLEALEAESIGEEDG